MSLRLDRLWLILGLFLAGEAYALGLGEITLNSALNEPLRARIELVSATPEDLAELTVALASAETFERYGIYRPLYLTRLEFTIVPSGRPDGNVILVRSAEPVTEPFVTFLVEASWPRGRLLREYTVLLDPPTFAPPPSSPAAEAVTAPTRAAPADRGRIQRSAAAEPAPLPAADQPIDNTPFDTAAGDQVRVQRGDTLWGIAERVRPDGRLSMNQTMLAIFAANPEAFGGNINRLNAGAMLRVPSADDIFRISRGDAASEVQRQNAAFGGGFAEPRLTLVPPDAAPEDYRAGATGGSSTTAAGGGDAAARIEELERTIEEQQSLIEVRDDELARLRDELAQLREQAATAAAATAAEAGAAEAAPETAEPPPATADETDRVFADDSAVVPEETQPAVTPPAEEAAPAPAPRRVQPSAAEEPGLVDRLVDVLTGFWGLLGIGLLLVLGVLVWLAKRAAGAGGEEESTGVWDALDADEEVDSESLASTERLRALARDDDSSIVVVEQDRAAGQRGRAEPAADSGSAPESAPQPALEDTFSSETAINLDQSDPIAEADFHMAYGLYDQAADLVNGALAVEPERQDLMAKLCEIYFVWGNRDAFVDAATRLHDQLGGETSPDWDKIVIMGRQIAPEHKLFAGATAAGATRAVDLALDDEEGGALDMDFAGGPDGPVSDIVDLSADGEGANEQSGIDFLFDDELDTGASTTREMASREDLESTLESPTVEAPAPDDEGTVESPTVEQPFDSLEKTTEIRPRKETSSEATAEIDLDDLGLDLDDLTASGLGLDDDESGGYADLDATAESGVLAANDDDDATGRNPRLDDALAATSEMAALDDATGKNPALRDPDEHTDTDVDLDFETTLLDATGQTQILPEDTLGDADKTLLAPVNDDDYVATAALSQDDVDDDFDFAKTEALPKTAFDGDGNGTGQGSKISGEATDLDLDLDDLTAALRVTDGDTVDQPRDDATVERPRVKSGGMIDLDLGDLGDFIDETPTEALSPEDFSDDLHEARTMTEVGTKLDLARAYVDMGDPDGARSILEEVLEEGDDGQRQQARKLIETLPA